jgi:hypothetical protein
MLRLFRLLCATAGVFLVVVVPASASSLSISAEPAKPSAPGVSEQKLTINSDADSQGDIMIRGYEVGSACPATPGGGNGSYGDEESVAQGSSTLELKAELRGGSVAHTHLCGWLTTEHGAAPFEPGSTTVADAPLKSYADVAGLNVLGLLLWKGGGTREYFTFTPWCSAGTFGVSDTQCAYSGRVRATVSSKLRKKLHLKSATILDHAFSGTDLAGPNQRSGKWSPPKGFNAKAVELSSVPVTMKVTWTAPIKTTFTAHGDIRKSGCKGQILGASYARPCGSEER